MKRKKLENCRNAEGFIDLNKLSGFIEKGAIVEGSNAKEWFNVDGERFLYKEYNSVLPCFGEVLYYRASLMCGVNCAEYDFATFGGNVGTISYDFLGKNEAYYNFLELTSQFGNSNFDLENIASNHDLLVIQNNKYNNLVSIKVLLNQLFHVSLEKKKSIEIELIKMYVLDTLFWHMDRTLWNYGIIVNEETDDVRLAKIYDNSYVLLLNKGEEYIEEMITRFIDGGVMENEKIRYSPFSLVCDEEDSIEQLINFYINSDEEIRNIIDDLIGKLDVEKIVKQTSSDCKIGDVATLWVKAILNFRKKTILRGLESAKINDDEAQMPNVTFSKRK